MTVSELIAALQQVDDQNLRVITEDGINPSQKTVIADIQVMHFNDVNDPDRDPESEPPQYVYLS